MKFNREILPYIRGEQFSASLKARIENIGKEIPEKDSILEQHLSGKKIIHLGFADHFEIIDERIQSGSWLHSKLLKWSEKCIGVDINEKAVNYIKTSHKISDIYAHDICSTNKLPAIIEDKWHYLLLGEILEHISNPVDFLATIAKNYSKYISNIIITVPNAYGLVTLRELFKNTEFINSDHRFWFTPYTLSKVCYDAGLNCDEFILCNSYYPLARWERFIVKRFPMFHHSLVAIGNFDHQSSLP